MYAIRSYYAGAEVGCQGEVGVACSMAAGALIVISLLSIFTRGFNYGIDFKGGRTYVITSYSIHYTKLYDRMLENGDEAEDAVQEVLMRVYCKLDSYNFV